MAELRFLTNEAGKVEGLAYAGFETFRGSPYTSCARETGQNSRDASVVQPVSVSFNLLNLPRVEIPFADELQHSIECCLLNHQDQKTKLHLERALNTIRAPHIKVLEISDKNTTGLTGPTSDPKSVFAALVKGDGVTNKTDMTSAGSFGIGKNAAFAVSDLQAVIYSTRYLDRALGAGELFAAQGRLRLISHTDGEKNLSAEGYWGETQFSAIENEGAVPAWMRRKAIGTSIFSIGFREEPNWVQRMTLSLAMNFFLAICRKEINFSVGDVQLNFATLDNILVSTELELVAIQTDQLDQLRRARRLLECFRSEASSRHKIAVGGLGEFILHLLVREGLPREVHVLRNGIYITDNFSKFSEPMRRFPSVREFIALLEPAPSNDGKLPSALLKQLENPAHDAFEPERLVDDSERELAKKQIKALIRKVREAIREVAKMEDLSSSHLDELSHLFGDNSGGSKKDREEDPTRFIYGPARPSRRTTPPGGLREGAGKGEGVGQRTGERQGEKKPRSAPATALRDVRSALSDVKDLRKRTVFFTPGFDGELQLAVAAVGLSADVELTVAQSSIGKAVAGKVTIPVLKGVRIAADLLLVEPFPGPIKLLIGGMKIKE